VPTANLMTRFTVEGAVILGVGNGDPNSHEPEQVAPGAGSRSLFNGLAQLLVRAGTGRGRITVRAQAEGLAPAVLTIARADVAPRPQVAVVPQVQDLRDWRRSPLLAEKPAATLAPADGDNNSWDFVRSGVATPAEAQPGWRVYRTRVTPWKRVAAEGGVIAFEAIGGKAELWVDGKQLATKATAAPGPLSAALPAGKGPRAVVLLVEAPAGTASGVLGTVSITPR